MGSDVPRPFTDLDSTIGDTLFGNTRFRSGVSELHLWFGRRPPSLARVATYLALTGDGRVDTDVVKGLATASPDEAVIRAARERIRTALDRLTGPSDLDHGPAAQPAVLDPFAGSGVFPMEALRLGCRTTAGELNPLAATLLRATLIYPARFGGDVRYEDGMAIGRVWSGLHAEFDQWAEVLAADVACRWSRVSSMMDPAAYCVWVRQIKCPACAAGVPLTPSVVLDRDGLAAEAEIRNGELTFSIQEVQRTKIRRRTIYCVQCKISIDQAELRTQQVLQLPAVLAAVATRSERQLVWSPPTPGDQWRLLPDNAARLADLLNGRIGRSLQRSIPEGAASTLRAFGANSFVDLFSPRQLLANLELCDAVDGVRGRMVAEGMRPEHLEALTAYLAFGIGYIAQNNCVLTRWDRARKRPVGVFARMNYDFCRYFVEGSPGIFLQTWAKTTSGSLKELVHLPPAATVLENTAEQLPLQDESFDAVVTDPPYFDSIPYADLADFFWAWESPFVSLTAGPQFFPRSAELVFQTTAGNARAAAVGQYREGLRNSFAECFRVLKKGRLLCLILTEKNREHFDSFVELSEDVGFEVVDIKRVPPSPTSRVLVAQGIFLVYLRKPSSPSEHHGLATDAVVVLERFDRGQPLMFEAVAQLLAERLEPEDIDAIVPPGSRGHDVERLQEALAWSDPRELLERNLGRSELRKIAREIGLLRDEEMRANPVDALLLHFGFRIPPPGKLGGVQQAIDLLRRNASRLRQASEPSQVNGLAAEGLNRVETMIRRGVFCWAKLAFGDRAEERVRHVLMNKKQHHVDLKRLSFGDHLTIFEDLPDEICQSPYSAHLRQKLGRAHPYLPKRPKNNSLADRIRKVVRGRNKIAHPTGDLFNHRDELVEVLDLSIELLNELVTDHAIPRVAVAEEEVRDMWGRITYRIRLDDGSLFEGTFSETLELGQEYLFFGSEVNPRPVDPILIAVDQVGEVV